MHARIVDVVSFLPKKIVKNSELINDLDKDGSTVDPFFHGVEQRHFAHPEYSSSDLGYFAVDKLLNKNKVLAKEIDLIICSCVFTDSYWPGIVTSIQHRIGAENATVLNIDTSCTSFLSGLNLADAYISSGKYKKILLVTVTNFISRLEEFQKSKKSFVLGDGATATLIVSDLRKGILASYEKSHGENYGLMRFDPDKNQNKCYLNYWESGCGPITVNFDKEMVSKITDNALCLIPEAVSHCLKKVDMQIDDVSLLITHQPNRYLINEWRARVNINIDKTHDTLAVYGNLFQGSVPITIADAIEKKKIKTGDKVLLASFSNGGDFVNATLIDWM